MVAPKGEKDLLSSVVRTGDAVEIDLDFSPRTALGQDPRQIFRPFPGKLPLQDNPDSISQIENCGSQHDQDEGIFRSEPRWMITLYKSGTYRLPSSVEGSGKCPHDGRLPKGGQASVVSTN